MSSKEFLLPFIKKEKITENIYSFYFDPKKTGFTFSPGQYIRMVLPHDDPDERGTSRFFTISSSPLEETLVITTKLFRSSFKNALMNVQPGEFIKMFGPLGTMMLHDEMIQPMVFLAGGMGITPFHSMLKYAAAQQLTLSLTLLVSFSKFEQKIFYQELTNISKEYKNIHITYLDSRISKEILRKYINDLSKPTYYIVGPPSMMEGVRELLTSLNVDEEKILTESFTGY